LKLLKNFIFCKQNRKLRKPTDLEKKDLLCSPKETKQNNLQHKEIEEAEPKT